MLPNRRATMLLCSVLAILFTAPLMVTNAYAQGSHLYKLGVGVGDEVEFTVDDAQNYHSLYNGNKVKFIVREIGTVTFYDESNSTAFSNEFALCQAYINGVGSILVLETPSLPGLHYCLSPPFFPAGQAFWRDFSNYHPSVRVEFGVYTTVLTFNNFFHYSYTGGNYTVEEYQETQVTATIDTTTGIMLRYQFNDKYEWLITGGFNFTYSSSVTLSRPSTNTYLAIPPEVAQFLAILLPVSLVGTVAFVYALKTRRARTRGTRKEEILGRLGDEELLRLARSISREVDDGASRASLTKTIRQSLSIEEIKRRIREGVA